MSSPRKRQILLTLVTVAVLASTALVATARGITSPEPAEAWVGSWSAALTPAGVGPAPWLPKEGFTNKTIRMVVHTSAGGSKSRIRLSNRYGAKPLTVGHASLAKPWKEAGAGDLTPGSANEVTFNGQKSVTIPAGGVAVSDAVTMDIPWAGDVAVSIFLPGPTGPATWHWAAKQTSFIGPGDVTTSASGAALSTTANSWFYLAGVDVLNRSGEGAIAVLGDSITDGFGSTSNASHRWTDYLSARLNKTGENGRAPGVLNLGLSGNRLNKDGTDFGFAPMGVNASARFYPDVLSQTGVRMVIVELGINDVWISHDEPDKIISSLRQIASVAHQSGLAVVVCTLMPWSGYEASPGAKTYSPTIDSIRLAVNSYIRTNSDFDAVIDFDAVMRDPANPNKLRAEWDSGDHIHPNDKGNEAMANAVSLDAID